MTKQERGLDANLQRWILIVLLAGIFLFLVIGGGITVVTFGAKAVENTRQEKVLKAYEQNAQKILQDGAAAHKARTDQNNAAAGARYDAATKGLHSW